MNDILPLLKSHKSIRRFQNKPIGKDLIKEIVEAAQSASTSSFMQAYTIIQIDNPIARKEIAHLCGDQKYVEEAPLFFVFCADLNHIELACQQNSTAMKKGYTETFIIATIDASLAAQNALIAAESMGLGGVFIGGIRNNPEKIVKLLEIPSNAYPVLGMCIGYPDQHPEIRPRLPIDVIYKIDKYSNEDEISKIQDYDKSVSEYYYRRTKGKRKEGWSQQMASKMEGELRPHMKEFLAKQGFIMK